MAALSAGVLPRIDHRAWAGKAQGDHTCACCTVPIKPPQVEYEPQAAPGLDAPVPCFSMWRQECGRLEHEGCDERGIAAASA